MGTLRLGGCGAFRGPFEEGGIGGSNLVLDGERGELVRAPVKVGKKGNGGVGRVEDARAFMALRNHSEAERRRRERINSHLARLRSLVPCSTIKLDKASLLAHVINHVKELKRKVTEVSLRHTIPSDMNEIHVEMVNDGIHEGKFVIKASLCCEDHPELIAELKQTLEPLQLKTVNAEISTLGGRVRHVFTLTSAGNHTGMEKRLLTTSVQQSLKSVLDRVSSQADVSTNEHDVPAKRRRTSQSESLSSS